jgi:serine/threonine protein phosphatase 1
MRKTYAIGDLHGRFDLLCKALDIIEADAGDDGGKLVVLGDFVDRGPQSAHIVELLKRGPKKPNWQWVVLQGNHEAMMLECLAHPGKLEWWLRNGGGQTLRSYGYTGGDSLDPLKIPLEHLDWLDRLPIYHEDDHRIFVHAGVPHDRHLAETDREILQWMLYDDEDSERYPGASYETDSAHVSGKHIVHGHHQNLMNPIPRDHRTNLDSFAWYGGRSAIGVFDGSQAKPIKIMDAICAPFA